MIYNCNQIYSAVAGALPKQMIIQYNKCKIS
jgi:hypothetical protein